MELHISQCKIIFMKMLIYQIINSKFVSKKKLKKFKKSFPRINVLIWRYYIHVMCLWKTYFKLIIKMALEILKNFHYYYING